MRWGGADPSKVSRDLKWTYVYRGFMTADATLDDPSTGNPSKVRRPHRDTLTYLYPTRVRMLATNEVAPPHIPRSLQGAPGLLPLHNSMVVAESYTSLDGDIPTPQEFHTAWLRFCDRMAQRFKGFNVAWFRVVAIHHSIKPDHMILGKYALWLKVYGTYDGILQ